MIIETVAYCVASSVGTAAIYAGFQFRRNIRNAISNMFMETSTKRLLELAQKQQLELDEYDEELGLSYEEYELAKPETEEEYLTRLKLVHPKAWDDYERYIERRPLAEESDMILYRNLLAYHAGSIKLRLTQHHALFDNGLTLWIENQYYGFGNITQTWVHSDSYTKKMMNFKKYFFESTDKRYTPYTFMWLVDTIFKEQHPSQWKTIHDEYTRNQVRKGK